MRIAWLASDSRALTSNRSLPHHRLTTGRNSDLIQQTTLGILLLSSWEKPQGVFIRLYQPLHRSPLVPDTTCTLPTPERPASSPTFTSDVQTLASIIAGTARKMTFHGPWSKSLSAFKKSVESMPSQYKPAFDSASKATLDKICNPEVLHVWESDSDIDSLLQLTSVIAKLCDLGVRQNKGANASDGSMLIIAEESGSRNNFSRICMLVEYLTGAEAKRHLDGTVAVYSKIVVVRGWDNSVLSGQKEALDKTAKRINTALERVLKMGGFHGDSKKVVWHHNAVIPFLLHWINTTTPALRAALSAITVTGSLDFTAGIAPSAAGRANKLAHLERLEQYAKKLDVPVVFVDSASQLISFAYLGTYMYYHAYYINTLLPPALSRPHLHKAQDELLAFAFRLRAASDHQYGGAAVKMVQRHLDARIAKPWARLCITNETYDKQACRAAAKDNAIHHAVQLADHPFALLSHKPSPSPSKTNNTIPAFARLALGPASASPHTTYTAAPITFSFRTSQLRPASPATLHLLIPQPGVDTDKITSHIQGLMMAVLERVRQEKGNPVLAEPESNMWRAVVTACTWALEAKLPAEVQAKVRFVRDKLKGGTWGFAVNGGGGGGGGSGNVNGNGSGNGNAAPVQSEAMHSYGLGPHTQTQTHIHSNGVHAQQNPGNQYPHAGHMNPAPAAYTAPQFPGPFQPPPPQPQAGYTQSQGNLFSGATAAGLAQPASFLPRQAGYT
ncbi:hypothetical protein ACJBU6_07699 [Exserohilum turcicum]